jgi:hypothetical protein
MDIPEKLATSEPQDKEKQNTNNVNKTLGIGTDNAEEPIIN